MKTNNDTVNVLFCGTGGQGVLKAAEVCGWAALYDGYHAKKSEVHGMAQRGGSVESHLRFGRQVYSPLIPRGAADILVSFHRGEHERLKDFMKAGGTDLVEYLQKAEGELADMRYLNTYLLGVLSKYLPLKEESWFKALETVFPSRYRESNKKVFISARNSATPL